MQQILLITALASLISSPFTSAAVTFIGSTLDFESATGSSTVNGVTVNLAANTGIINATSEGLGINAPGGGDDTDGLDTINATEILTFSFDQDITFQSISINDVGVNDAIALSFNNGPLITLDSTDTHTLNQELLTGQTLTITALAPNAPTTQNNGVRITQFTVVPEPSTALLLALSCALATLRRRRC